ncbi:unnamed protein product, partial [Prorocentrum cordatum]
QVLSSLADVLAGQRRIECKLAGLERALGDGGLPSRAAAATGEDVLPLPSPPDGDPALAPGHRAPFVPEAAAARGDPPRDPGAAWRAGEAKGPGALQLAHHVWREHGVWSPDRLAAVGEADQWPRNVQLRPEVVELRNHRGSRPDSVTNSEFLQSAGRLRAGLLTRGTLGRTTMLPSSTRYDGVALDPEWRGRRLIDCLSLLALFHDLVTVPFALAFDIAFQGFFRTASWAAAAFWAVDLAMGLVTGYYKDGELELRLRPAMKHFLRTRFAPYSALLFCDVASNLIDESISSAPMALRAIRLFGLLRVLRFAKLVGDLVERVLVDAWRLVLRGVEVFLVIIWLNHLFSCCWYYIGRKAHSDTGGRWFDSLDVAGDVPSGTLDPVGEFERASDLYRYMTSLHWSMSQLTAGGVEGITPLNSAERQFNIFCLLFGLLFGSSLVSTLSATMTQLNMMKQEQTQKLLQLRHFLDQHSISPTLCVRVQRQVMQRMSKRPQLTDKDVLALSLLSTEVHADLRLELMGPHLMRHPVLLLIFSISEATIRMLCRDAVEMMVVAMGDTVFEAGKEAETAYCVMDGSVRYESAAEGGKIALSEIEMTKKPPTRACGPGTWLCEVALWTRWTHVGTCRSPKMTQLLTLCAESMLRILLRAHVVRDVVVDYCKQYHKRVVSAVPPRHTYPTDLDVAGTDFCELVLRMDPATQLIAGEAALRVLGDSLDKRKIARLESELHDGRSCIMMDGDEIQRAVEVSVLHLERDDHCVLAQVGKMTSDGAEPVCQLPGAKQRQAEPPSEAVQRILSNIAGLVPSIVLDGADLEVYWKESPSFGIRTKYFRTRHYGSVELGAPPAEGPPRGGAVRAVPLKELQHSGEREEELETVRTVASTLQVYLLSTGPDSGKLYAWLPLEDLESLSSRAGAFILRKWIGLLDFSAVNCAPTTEGEPPERHPSESWELDLPRAAPSATLPRQLLEKKTSFASLAMAQEATMRAPAQTPWSWLRGHVFSAPGGGGARAATAPASAGRRVRPVADGALGEAEAPPPPRDASGPEEPFGVEAVQAFGEARDPVQDFGEEPFVVQSLSEDFEALRLLAVHEEGADDPPELAMCSRGTDCSVQTIQDQGRLE